MLKFMLIFAISVWITSSLFMIGFWLNAFITTFRRDGKIFVMPFGHFLYIHFCPIMHTVKCFEIFQRIARMKREV